MWLITAFAYHSVFCSIWAVGWLELVSIVSFIFVFVISDPFQFDLFKTFQRIFTTTNNFIWKLHLTIFIQFDEYEMSHQTHTPHFELLIGEEFVFGVVTCQLLYLLKLNEFQILTNDCNVNFSSGQMCDQIHFLGAERKKCIWDYSHANCDSFLSFGFSFVSNFSVLLKHPLKLNRLFFDAFFSLSSSIEFSLIRESILTRGFFSQKFTKKIRIHAPSKRIYNQ